MVRYNTVLGTDTKPKFQLKKSKVKVMYFSDGALPQPVILYVYIYVHVYIYVSIYIDASWPVIIPFTRIIQLCFCSFRGYVSSLISA